MNNMTELNIEELKEIINNCFVDSDDDIQRKATDIVKESVKHTFIDIRNHGIRNISEMQHDIAVNILKTVVLVFEDQGYDERLAKSVDEIFTLIDNVLRQYELHDFDGDVIIINPINKQKDISTISVFDCDLGSGVMTTDPNVTQKISRRYGNKGVSFKDVTDEHSFRLELKDPIMTSTEVLRPQENNSDVLKTFICEFAGVYLGACAVTFATDKESAREKLIQDIIKEYPYLRENVMKLKIEDIIEVNGTYLICDGDY